jgi:hypothetical protein
MKGTTWVTVELWNESEDGTEVAQQYDVECSYYCIPGTHEEPAEFDIDVINYNGVKPNTELAKEIDEAVCKINWDNILAELSWLNY